MSETTLPIDCPVIDFHVHAFPDRIAARVITQLGAAIKRGEPVTARLDGTVAAVLRSMDAAGISQSVVSSIATRPEQFPPILEWSHAIRSERIIPFLSVHPADPDAIARIRRVRREGFLGVKLHPYYQEFAIDEQRLFPFYVALEEEGLIAFFHAGFDPGYDLDRIADPARLARVIEAFPGLRVVAAHFGAWRDWDLVRRHLLGKPIWFDISFMIEYMSRTEAIELLTAHPRDRVLFGTDSPWADQREAQTLLLDLELDTDLTRRILGANAAALLAAAARA